MADGQGPAACAACGRPLPPQRKKGRRRRYCDARCRDAARRERARSARSSPAVVKASLTAPGRHEYLDAVAAARELAAASDAALQQAVDRARDAGHSWREVGDVLGTSRQAAFQRFGRPVDPRTGLAMTRILPPDAADRAVAIFAWHDEGRWAEIIGELDDTMRGLHSPQLLARGWATMASLYGRLERIGAPYPRPGSEDAVVIVPLFFEAGEARGMVRFGADGRIAGMAIRPAVP
jgi:hypothetical protein